MSEIILVTGGARSGKSTIAEKILLGKKEDILYIATSIAFDEEMVDRIKKHQERRDERWKLAETYKDFHKLVDNDDFKKCKYILLDCITVMLSNRLFDKRLGNETDLDEYDVLESEILEDIENLLKISRENDKTIVIVTNELGMGIVPIDRISRMYRDIAGRINQNIASQADKVILAVSGIGVDIKKLEIDA
ncbi:adenosylcobinamide kinase /adenosylcobinamide-phosphate guanylyltransferase [Dethiosulfatibacter aminovorans DSM 17477]|uniref:Adenosylcobinamide kinase n=1 Tax=Dethiosulfatibacter aminovorans DSM 17477 TaxID=1121476 RepID=A0A1M6GQZ8_9FIRM|nr:bifunctional adenosylcobinamide kinase/adenosylcobinamide-phosphate guanylyltransferase [Dethiosulfatibacter aminovorans]SHJ12394.1 adenosylcobinamide kinase /adenosylcobinamide-phosphate guanylyltransferase [Dethiosulfatibacter aminovorans DSM 17477]